MGANKPGPGGWQVGYIPRLKSQPSFIMLGDSSDAALMTVVFRAACNKHTVSQRTGTVTQYVSTIRVSRQQTEAVKVCHHNQKSAHWSSEQSVSTIRAAQTDNLIVGNQL